MRAKWQKIKADRPITIRYFSISTVVVAALAVLVALDALLDSAGLDTWWRLVVNWTVIAAAVLVFNGLRRER